MRNSHHLRVVLGFGKNPSKSYETLHPFVVHIADVGPLDNKLSFPQNHKKLSYASKLG